MIQALIDALAIPDSCLLDKPVFKKMFLDHAELDVTDRKALSEDVSRIRWLYTLKPDTINISPYQDNDREFLEIAVLAISLSSPARVRRIASLMHRAIPYPLILIFEDGKKACISTADKRINQADKAKLVIEDRWLTGWIDASAPNETQRDFLEALAFTMLPSTNFYALYEAYQALVIAIIAAERSGTFQAGHVAASKQQAAALRKIEAFEREIGEHKAKLKRETQMAAKITLNSAIRTRKDAILTLTSEFSNLPDNFET